MKALSIRQPWAWLIVNALKDIENRTWATKFRGRIYVHASGRFCHRDYWALKPWLPRCFGYEQLPLPSDLPRGAIIGEVDIIGCVSGVVDNPWFVGPYGLVLANPVAYDKPIPYKGRLGFFEVIPHDRL